MKNDFQEITTCGSGHGLATAFFIHSGIGCQKSRTAASKRAAGTHSADEERQTVEQKQTALFSNVAG